MLLPIIRELSDLPAHWKVLCGISFGYGDTGHPANGFAPPALSSGTSSLGRRTGAAAGRHRVRRYFKLTVTILTTTIAIARRR
jgi:hypothetical protein